MNSPQGTAGTLVDLDRDSSISPQLLDRAQEPCNTGYTIGGRPDSSDHRKIPVQSASSLLLKFPPSVIVRILWSVDANTFASLSVLNRAWRRAAQSVELYAYHLSRCPSYALSNSIISGPFRRNDLSRLKARFAAEVRRNLFEAYLRPRRTLINLISINANSSAAFPAGEAFRFEFSPNSRTIVALSSSRMYVLDATADPPTVVRHLKTLRRPLSASITDDGSLLAVLSSKHQVNIYGLTPQGVQHLQVIVLDNPPKIIAIAHEGTVLAASYETGIEVFSLAANTLTTDRRAVRSESVDTLSFSGDGSMLVGSSLSLEEPNAVVISAPFYTENDPDLSDREVHSRMWTTQILFPQISSVCSHVALLPGHIEGDACWLFAYDHSLMSYRAVRTDDTRTGVAYFLSPPGADRFDTPVPTFSPSASACGTLVVAGFEGSGLCLYGVPERLDVSPDMSAIVERENQRYLRNRFPLTSATGITEPLMAYSPSTAASDQLIEDDALASKVDWRQSLFVKLRVIPGLAGQTAARWVEHPDSSNLQSSKRLVVVAPGGVTHTDELADEGMPVDGSRLCLLDFNFTPSVLPERSLTIEVGEEEPEILTEHTGSLAAEVAMERRRTIRAIPTAEAARAPLGRSFTSMSPPPGPLIGDEYRRGSASTPSSPIEQFRGSQAFPAGGLHRSATASGFRHARYPPRPPLGSTQYMGQNHNVYHRTDRYGRPLSEDSWETPPPPYIGANGPSSAQQNPYGSARNGEEQTLSRSPQSNDEMTPLPIQNQYRPYRSLVAERRSATLDAIMSSQALPTGPSMSQYDELMMVARSRGPSESSIDPIGGPQWNFAESPNVWNGTTTPFSNASPHGGSRRTRPMSHHGAISSGWQGPSRSVSLPTTSSYLDDLGELPHEQFTAGYVTPAVPREISLTGTNLQNRLNYPIPPVPQIPIQHSSVMRNAGPSFGAETSDQFQQLNEQTSYAVSPTPDHLGSQNRGIGLSETHRPPAIKNTNFVHKVTTAGLQLSPPRGTRGATGDVIAPASSQMRNVPNEYLLSRGDSRGSQTSNLASTSAPNLLTQNLRYSRLDTLDSMNNTNGLDGHDLTTRARAYSMVLPGLPANAEPSAYYETSRSGPGHAAPKPGKRAKRKKEETVKKGSRCVVM